MPFVREVCDNLTLTIVQVLECPRSNKACCTEVQRITAQHMRQQHGAVKLDSAAHAAAA